MYFLIWTCFLYSVHKTITIKKYCLCYSERVRCFACVKPATTASLCNHQCVVSVLQKILPVRCNSKSSIKFLLRYQEKNWRSEIVFLILIHRNMIKTILRYAYFPQFWRSQWVKMHVTVMLAELCRICG